MLTKKEINSYELACHMVDEDWPMPDVVNIYTALQGQSLTVYGLIELLVHFSRKKIGTTTSEEAITYLMDKYLKGD